MNECHRATERTMRDNERRLWTTSRSTAYDAEFRAKRDAALANAGYTVIRGNVSERMETL